MVDTSWADGAGIVSDIAKTVAHLSDGDFEEAAASGVAAVTDAFAYSKEPLGALLFCGAGWLIEHLSFLKQPLDLLAGNPEAIKAQSGTWREISAQLGNVGAEYARRIDVDTAQWQSEAAENYRAYAEKLIISLTGFADAATGLSKGIELGGTMVGMERGFIRDVIAAFISKVIERAIIALSTSWCTGGASIAALVADTAAEGSVLAVSCANRIAALVNKLAELIARLHVLGDKVDQLIELLRRNATGK